MHCHNLYRMWLAQCTVHIASAPHRGFRGRNARQFRSPHAPAVLSHTEEKRYTLGRSGWPQDQARRCNMVPFSSCTLRGEGNIYIYIYMKNIKTEGEESRTKEIFLISIFLDE